MIVLFRRSRALMLMTVLFILCWYPLYILTLVDPKFHQPTKIYKLLTFIAWSNASINPLVLLLFDSSIGLFRPLTCCVQLCYAHRLRRHSLDGNNQDSFVRFRTQIRTVSQSSSIAASMNNSPGRTYIPEQGRTHIPAQGRTPINAQVRTYIPAQRRTAIPATAQTPIPAILSTPESVYLRVGCRLCHEGQSHSNAQCNGGNMAPTQPNCTSSTFLEVPGTTWR